MSRPIWERMSPDALQAGLERAGAAASKARRMGLCPHSWTHTRTETNAGLYTGQHPEKWAGLAVGQVICLDCGEVFPNDKAQLAAHHAALEAGGYRG